MKQNNLNDVVNMIQHHKLISKDEVFLRPGLDIKYNHIIVRLKPKETKSFKTKFLYYYKMVLETEMKLYGCIYSNYLSEIDGYKNHNMEFKILFNIFTNEIEGTSLTLYNMFI